MVPSSDGGDDFVRVGSPREGLWLCVGFGEEVVDEAEVGSYLIATSLPLFLSSQRTILMLGAIILVGSAVAYVSYWEVFVSVGCFFAATASIVILCHFEGRADSAFASLAPEPWTSMTRQRLG